MNDAFAVPEEGEEYAVTARLDELPIGGDFGPDTVTQDDGDWETVEIPNDLLRVEPTNDGAAVVVTRKRDSALPERQNMTELQTLTEPQANLTELQNARGGAQAPPSPQRGRIPLAQAGLRAAHHNGETRGALTNGVNAARDAKMRVESRLPPSALEEMQKRVQTFGPRADDADWLIRDGADRVVEAARLLEARMEEADRTLLERDARVRGFLEAHERKMAESETRILASVRAANDSNDALAGKLLERFATMTDVIKDLTKHALETNTQEAFVKGGKLASDVLADDAKKKLTAALKSAGQLVNLVVIERRWIAWATFALVLVQFAVFLAVVFWPHMPHAQPVVMKPRR